MTVTPFLRNTLYLDALASGATALLMLLGAPLLSGLLELPEPLLFWAGLVLIPFVAMLVVVARRNSVPNGLLPGIIVLNVLWVIASFALLLSGTVAPNALGIAFVVAQALAVAAFAELQFIAIRRSATFAAA